MRLISKKTNIDFLAKRNIGYGFSIILILLSIGLFFYKGLNLGIDFTGGVLIEIRSQEEIDIANIRSNLNQSGLSDVSLQYIGDGNKDLMVRIGLKSLDKTKIIELAKNAIGDVEYRKLDYVGPKIGKELVINGTIALLTAFIAILIYIWLRFEWQFGIGAVIALVHDIIISIGFFSATQLEFNLSSIAAFLTIIGYSINDSVVIYDRIRENLRKLRKKNIVEILNVSLNETLARTLQTSITTIIALLALVIFGGEVIKSFSLAMLFGVIIGTYSSIFVASPVLTLVKLKRS